ncbi:conserved hypothetical protein [Ricinus communis]|uniref:Uncharacterized protein n=1 Tax=Ricinus communis TaxID=3988 RepID=B9SFS9_RICCO|nr:conserved hypothetical protein [Ricinus communis]
MEHLSTMALLPTGRVISGPPTANVFGGLGINVSDFSYNPLLEFFTHSEEIQNMHLNIMQKISEKLTNSRHTNLKSDNLNVNAMEKETQEEIKGQSSVNNDKNLRKKVEVNSVVEP